MGLREFLINQIERKQISNSIFARLIRRFFWGRFRYVYANYPDRSTLSQKYWGRKGGFEHAKSQFIRIDWMVIYAPFYNAVNSLLSGLSKANIIEIGCGMGQWCSRLNLHHSSFNYLGLDVNEFSIIEANKYFCDYDNVYFVQSVISEFQNFGDFDIVLSCQVLFFLSKEEIYYLLDSIACGSTIVLFEPVNRNDSSSSSCLLDYSNTKHDLVGFSHNYKSILDDKGYKVMQLDYHSDTSRILCVARKISA